ncbi:MAG: DciA family protein [Planctomycetota bacterium]
MNERQYQQVVANRRGYEVSALFTTPTAAGLLREAARQGRRQQQAVEAWSRVAPQRVRGEARVESFDKGALRIAVANAAAGQYLREQSATLLRELSGVLPGLRRLNIVADNQERQYGESSRD